MVTPPGPPPESDPDLGELSLAEWEYAWRYADHLSLGDPAPDASGFDPARAAAIRAKLVGVWKAHIKTIRKPASRR